jgi:hypothetical protein
MHYYEQILIPNLISKLIEYNIPVELKINTQNDYIMFRVHDFKKTGHVDLIPEWFDTLKSYSRWEKEFIINDLYDLAKLNAVWAGVQNDRDTISSKKNLLGFGELWEKTLDECVEYSANTLSNNWQNLIQSPENLKEFSASSDSCMTYPNEILQSVIRKNINVSLIMDSENKFGYQIEGFYKSGNIKLFYNPQSDDFKAIARYDTEDTIYDLEDLINLNINWAQITQEKNSDKFSDFTEVMKSMEPKWLELAVENNVLEEKIETKKVYTLK